jgi:hypothetical protein
MTDQATETQIENLEKDQDQQWQLTETMFNSLMEQQTKTNQTLAELAERLNQHQAEPEADQESEPEAEPEAEPPTLEIAEPQQPQSVPENPAPKRKKDRRKKTFKWGKHQ